MKKIKDMKVFHGRQSVKKNNMKAKNVFSWNNILKLLKRTEYLETKDKKRLLGLLPSIKISFHITLMCQVLISFCFRKKGQIKFSHDRNWIVFFLLFSKRIKEKKTQQIIF